MDDERRREITTKYLREKGLDGIGAYHEHINAVAERVEREVREECATIVLEQRCQRETEWDAACVAIAAAIRGKEGP